LVWLHGFTQTKASSHLFRSILTARHEVLTLDLPGHGENAQVEASLDETATLLHDVLPAEPFILGGYSFGARVALHFALHFPERLSRLVLLSGTLGIYDEDERRLRRERDDALARRLESIEIDAFLDEWLAQPLFASLPPDPLERRARSRDARGLAASLRYAGTGTQRWLGPDAERFFVPTTVLAGERDEKFVREANLLAATIPHATVTLVTGAGHAAHLEAPAECARLLSDPA